MRRADDTQNISARTLPVQGFAQFTRQELEPIRLADCGRVTIAGAGAMGTALGRSALLARRFGRFRPGSLALFHSRPDKRAETYPIAAWFAEVGNRPDRRVRTLR